VDITINLRRIDKERPAMFFLAGFFVPYFSSRSASAFGLEAENFLPLRDFNIIGRNWWRKQVEIRKIDFDFL
jgi:hypothetical protein